jgi:hypothetical protein
MKVTNKHHFCQGVTLEINDDKLQWTVDKSAQRFKYGTIRVQDDGPVVIMDPLASNAIFIALMNMIFEFTGVPPSELEIDPPIIDRQEVIDRIYAQPLERKIRLVYVEESCDCEQPYRHDCPGPQTITKLELMPLATTYGEFPKAYDAMIDTEQEHEFDPDTLYLHFYYDR